MPPRFTAQEKARITELLVENGRRLFTTQGLRKTSLEELVAGTGIAKSSFYQFFAAKEALYLHLMLRQMAEVKEDVIDGALLSADDVREGLRRFLRAILDRLAADPLYRRLMTHPEEMAAVARRLDSADTAALTASPDNPAVALHDFLARKRAEGAVADADPAVLVGVLQAVLMLPIHADRLADPALLPHIQDLLIDVVAAGLTPRKD
ncbi:TetR/AcrR family transcriptional regulator [Streptomonospora sp. S1-112]|uniref:TetR/AcrR family transcriptional regulator n=1 Tax=Streptomonospora mangrovi TaxID=2883123 RepID=A0A9X3NU98_9ACTN|nr:TetR/AcrR family transcriptional regulator [Streptomonospora mangrovi]MDA0564201.1 TetR/AcrR family transcriptional regulator [Streptomonospora mangrovi]